MFLEKYLEKNLEERSEFDDLRYYFSLFFTPSSITRLEVKTKGVQNIFYKDFHIPKNVSKGIAYGLSSLTDFSRLALYGILGKFLLENMFF